jgi:hypothetical protein
MASETGKAELHDILRSSHLFTDVSPELLQRMLLFTSFEMPEPNKWQSAKEVLVTSFQISEIQRCVQVGFFIPLHSNKKAREKPLLLSCWHILKLKERPYSRLLQQMKPGSIILNWKRRAIHGLQPSSVSLGKKKLKNFP